MASQVAKNPKRFATFCSLSMHDAKQASVELARCVKEYGMVGAMLNDFQMDLMANPFITMNPNSTHSGKQFKSWTWLCIYIPGSLIQR